MLVTLSGIVTFVKPQPSNALLPILETLAGILMFSKPVQAHDLNAEEAELIARWRRLSEAVRESIRMVMENYIGRK